MSARSLEVKRLPCIACHIEDKPQPNKTEAHHLNLDSHKGQVRLGDEYQIPLCQWHHRGIRPVGMSIVAMTGLYGPSWEFDSTQFRLAYGPDMELWVTTNRWLERLLPAMA